MVEVWSGNRWVFDSMAKTRDAHDLIDVNYTVATLFSNQ